MMNWVKVILLVIYSLGLHAKDLRMLLNLRRFLDYKALKGLFDSKAAYGFLKKCVIKLDRRVCSLLTTRVIAFGKMIA